MTDKKRPTQQQQNQLWQDAYALAGKIGPRGTGTAQEAAAAAYVASRLQAMGLQVEIHTFPAIPSQNTFAFAINILALTAIILYPVGGAIARWLATLLALVAAPLLWQTIRSSDNALRFLLPKVISQNVIARVSPRDEVHSEAVLLAHLDTNRCRKVWASGTVKYLEPLTFLTLALLAVLGLIYLAGALMGGPAWTWWASLPLAGYVVGSLITLWLDDGTPFSPGAHDNAASVAVSLAAAAELAICPLEHTQVWLAFTGAEETDHAGLKTLLKKHNDVLRGATFLDLEGVGSGELVYLIEQGLCAHYRPDPELVLIAAQVSQEHLDLQVKPGEMTMEDETGTLRRRGYKALCIAGMDPETRSLPHWHRADDTVDTLSIEVMGRAAAFVTAFLRTVDKEARREKMVM